MKNTFLYFHFVFSGMVRKNLKVHKVQRGTKVVEDPCSHIAKTELYIPTLPTELNLPDQYVVPSPDQYFPLPTLIAAVGPRGKGKTYSLSLWNKWMFDNAYFTRFYAIDPTYESNDCVKVIPMRPGDLYTDVNRTHDALADIEQKIMQEAEFYKSYTEEYPKKYAEYLSFDRNISKMDPLSVRYLREHTRKLNEYYDELESMNEEMTLKCKTIAYILSHRERSPYLNASGITSGYFDDLHPWFPSPPKLVHPAPLLFLDDLSHTELYSPSRSNPLNNLTLRHRHLGGQGYGVSIEFAVQTFKTGVTKALRENTQQFLLFATRDVGVIEGMYEGLGSHCTYEEFLCLYNHATAEDHGFLLVDNNAKSIEKTFRKGWDTLLLGFVDYETQKCNVEKKALKVPIKKSDATKRPRSKIHITKPRPLRTKLLEY